jgi:hypothetical protein
MGNENMMNARAVTCEIIELKCINAKGSSFGRTVRMQHGSGASLEITGLSLCRGRVFDVKIWSSQL